jgi:hypothetical protein
VSATDNENVRELLGRERKIRKLCAALDIAMRFLGVEPVNALEHVEQLAPGAWIDMARRAGCNAPSTETIAAVIAVYRDERPALLARMGA